MKVFLVRQFMKSIVQDWQRGCMPTGNLYPTKVRISYQNSESSIYSLPFYHLVVILTNINNYYIIVIDSLLIFYLGETLSLKIIKVLKLILKWISLKIYCISSFLRCTLSYILTSLKGGCVIQWVECHPLLDSILIFLDST